MKQKKHYCGIGGQAVLKGIMMRNGDYYSLAVRKDDGSIVVEKNKYECVGSKKLRKIPFIRGIFALIDSFTIGTKMINRSAELLTDEIEEEPTKFEIWLNKHFGEQAEKVLMAIITFFSVIFAICIFVFLPTFLSMPIKKITDSRFLIAFVEGILRIIIFILYIKMISKMPDIRETFEYHGSEHKCINCIESGLELNVENVLKSSKEHKRCGTSFIVYVMIISIFLFMFIPTTTVWIKLVSRILLIPVIAGISYEIIRIMGQFDNTIVNIISKPGMLMQGLTTYEPNEAQVEVAIKAVEEVFDWKKFEKENFNS